MTITDVAIEDISRRDFISGAVAAGFLAGCSGGDDAESEPPTSEVPERSSTNQGRSSLRVAALDPRTLDILVALGVQVVATQPAGTDVAIPGYIADRSAAPIEVIGDGGTLNLEALAATEPDLLIGTTDQGELGPSVEGIAPLELYDSALFRQDGDVDWRPDIRSVGDLIGRRADAEDLVAMLELRFAQTARLLDGKQGTGIGILRAFGPDGYRLYGPGTVPSAIAADAGIVLARLPQQPEPGRFVLDFSPERIVDVTADHLFVSIGNFGDVGGDDEFALLDTNPLWNQVPAVQAGNTARILDTSAWFIGGPIGWPVMLDELETYFQDR